MGASQIKNKILKPLLTSPNKGRKYAKLTGQAFA